MSSVIGEFLGWLRVATQQYRPNHWWPPPARHGARFGALRGRLDL